MGGDHHIACNGLVQQEELHQLLNQLLVIQQLHGEAFILQRSVVIAACTRVSPVPILRAGWMQVGWNSWIYGTGWTELTGFSLDVLFFYIVKLEVQIFRRMLNIGSISHEFRFNILMERRIRWGYGCIEGAVL